jgi:two-component system, NtrC family, response regulator AtoC
LIAACAYACAVSRRRKQILSVKRRLPTLERELIARALERTRGNRTRAAEMLELSTRALSYKIQEYGLS